ncbi:MBL fold metallo-hydrolase, partial [bacterium]|nr:MBL fold metallo-hydrolase [bacterium]
YVINTHSHYDHIWGNCIFENCQIISHRLCREKILSDGEKVLEEFKEKEPKLILGDIKIKAPDIIFEDELTFFSKNISVKLKHFKGHTKDGIVIILEPYHICIAGDLVEEPFPIVNEEDSNLTEFISSLEVIDKMGFNFIIPSHGNRLDNKLIKENLYYLKQLYNNSISKNYCIENNITSEFYQEAHEENINSTKGE